MLRDRDGRLLSMRLAKRAFPRSESGATAIEYALIAGIVSIAIVAGATEIGLKLGDIFQALSDAFAKL